MHKPLSPSVSRSAGHTYTRAARSLQFTADIVQAIFVSTQNGAAASVTGQLRDPVEFAQMCHDVSDGDSIGQTLRGG